MHSSLKVLGLHLSQVKVWTMIRPSQNFAPFLFHLFFCRIVAVLKIFVLYHHSVSTKLYLSHPYI